MRGQDKVYLLDGSSKTGVIEEISSESVILKGEENAPIPRESVMLLEFKNGKTEVINRPKSSTNYNPTQLHNSKEAPAKNNDSQNMMSLNTLALCNADISGFYERFVVEKRFGIGAMAAYNFNASAGLQNFFIAVLSNAKKKYDAGIFANFYTRKAVKGNGWYYGVLFKYTSFTFSKATEEKVTSGGVTSVNIRYSSAEGSQFATMFTCGTVTNFNRNIFLKTIMGVGGFRLRGDYRQQYNYYLNKAAATNNQGGAKITYDRSVLMKIYLGINIGCYF